MPANGLRTSWSATVPSTSPTAIDVPAGWAVSTVKTPAHGLTMRRSTAKRCSPSRGAGAVERLLLTQSMSLSSSSGVATLMVRASSTVRFAIPVSTPPGPSSTKPVTPSSAIVSRECFQRTGLDSCAERSDAHSSPELWARASTLEMTATSVSRGCAEAMARRKRSRAAVMNGVWKAPDTCKGITFFAPSSLA